MACQNARMELRPELCPPVISAHRVAALCAEIDHITDLLERDQSADSAINAFNADTGHDYTAYDFLTYGASRTVQDFAIEAARPASPRVPDITRDELVEIVRRIPSADNDVDYYVLLLETNVRHPHVTGLLFWPPAELADASPEAIVDAALSYKPIAL